ncbi:transglycosylase family protein [Streptomyces oryzae]|uniref:Transglycosylase family protein n=1 Tax=Streptomyces oryzae TaxID=1434886 RepID=A0ABS3XLX0_9ACTN|nr:transglycosylase family protein [Streptomyces oryzae]MBO8196409.1 transglycosylase family protein [Streptomyces oryzae]
MRSGNGRHRRPRQAPALFVAAGVTGAGIAIPLLGATGAQAADGSAWDRVADCESGGAWSANDSNGYYGGLQLDLDTWKYYGGTVYAERPDLADRSEQIAIAEKILEAEGPRAFPHCGTGLKVPGLDDSTDPAPSGTPSPSPSDESGKPEKPGKPDDSGKPSQSGKPSTPGKSSPDAKPSHSAKPGDDASGKPSDEKSGGKSDGKSGKGSGEESDTPGGDASESPQPPSGGGSDSGSSDDDSAGAGSSGWSDLGPSSPDRLKSPSEKVEKPDTPEESGKPGKPGKGKHRGRPADDDRASRDRAREGGGKHRVTVRPGDSLSGIAAEHDVAGGWSELYERNRAAIGDDPDLLRPGLHLKL